METRETSEPYQLRLLLMLCTLPQAVGIYCGLIVPRVVGEVFAVGYLPEGTQLPLGTRLVMALSPISQSGQKRWDFQYQMDVALIVAIAWIVAIFTVVWWTHDRAAMTRRWIVMSSVAWTLIAGWMLFAATGLGVPLIPISGLMHSPSAVPVSSAMTIEPWDVLKVVAFGSLVAFSFWVWRRDRRRRL